MARRTLEPPHPDLPVVTHDEAALLLRVSPRQFFNMRSSGLISPVKVGKRGIRFKREEVNELIERLKDNGNGNGGHGAKPKGKGKGA